MNKEIEQVLAGALCVVFDFDGTLVDSNEIKWMGFEHVFAEYEDRMQEIRAYCRSYNHTIRGEKFRHVAENILNIKYTSERALEFHKRYAEYTTTGVASAPEIPGAADFVRKVASFKPALLSSTPHDILLEILDRRGWRSMFAQIQGAPIRKAAWLLQLRQTLRCSASEIFFFGDTDEDAAAGAESGCTFLRVGRQGIKDFTAFLS